MADQGPVVCSPEQLRELADLLAQNRIGEVRVDIDPGTPTPVDHPVPAEIRRKLGWLGNIRTMRGAFGEYFTANVLNPLAIIMNKYESFRSNAFKAFMDSLEPMGIKGLYKRARSLTSNQNKSLYNAIMDLDDNNRYVGPLTTSEVLESARAVNAYMKKIGDENGIRVSMYKEYRRAVVANGGKGGLLYTDNEWGNAFKGALQGQEADFFWELERRGVPRNWDATASSLFQDYVNAVGSKRILTPALNQLEDDVVRPFFGLRFYRNVDGLGTYAQDGAGYAMWRDLRNHIYGQPTEMDKTLAAAWNRMFGLTGVNAAKATPSDVYSVGSAIGNLFYGGVLSTPGAIVRQVFQLVPSVAELGVRPVIWGLHKLFSTTVHEGVEMSYAKALIKRGILVPPLEAIHEQVGLARSMGRNIHKLTETALYLFDASDRMMRIITAGGAELRFNEALQRGIESLRAPKDLKEQLVRLVRQGRENDARDLYMIDMVAKTQYIYGRVNRPEMMRGAFGQAIGMLQSYPLNWIEMYNVMGKRFVRGATGKEPMSEMLPLLRQLGLSTGIILGGAHAFGTDLSSNFISFPGQAPIPQMLSATFSAGKTNFDWTVGHMFGLGETDYHKRLRSEANNQFKRGVTNFIPGGLLFKKGYDVVDEPTFVNVMRLMGFPPMAEEINLEIRAKASQKRQEKKFEQP